MLEIPPLPATRSSSSRSAPPRTAPARIPGGGDHDELGVVVESPDQVVGLDEHGFKTVMQRT